MGIKNFHKFITTYSPRTIVNRQLGSYRGQTFAVDANLMLYKMLGKCIAKNCYEKEISSFSNDFLYEQLVDVIECARKLSIKLIFVFDGPTPDIKLETVELRRKKRERRKVEPNELVSMTIEERRKAMMSAIHLTGEMRDESKRTLAAHGVEVITAPHEADSQCAKLSRDGIVDGVVTDDYDILAFGGKKIIMNIFKYKDHRANHYVSEICLDRLLVNLKITFDSFVDMCILMGTDYSKKTGLHYNDCFNIIKKYKDIEHYIGSTGSGETIDLGVKFHEIRKYFKDCEGIEYVSGLSSGTDCVYVHGSSLGSSLSSSLSSSLGSSLSLSLGSSLGSSLSSNLGTDCVYGHDLVRVSDYKMDHKMDHRMNNYVRDRSSHDTPTKGITMSDIIRYKIALST